MKPRRRPLPPNDELRERFGQNIRECRNRIGISQEELSVRCGSSLTTVGPMERGLKLPRIDTFIRLAGALGVAPNELVTGISWAPPEATMTPGAFEVPDDPELAAKIAALRASAYERGRRRGRA